MEYDQSEGMIDLMIFLNDCFIVKVTNDPGTQRRNLYMLYEVLEKSVVSVFRDQIHCIRGT